jgi:hypothetical protein
MTIRYLYNAAGGADNGTSWADAYETLAAAFTGSTAGDTIYVADDHAETQGSAMTLTSPGTIANPVYVICADRGGTVPPVSADITTGASLSTTGAFSIATAGFAYCEGVLFSAGDAANAASLNGTGGAWYFKNCIFKLNNTAASQLIRISNNAVGCATVWDNCQLQFGATTHAVSCLGNLVWKNTASALIGGTYPGTNGLFTGALSGRVHIHGVDLTNLTNRIIPTAATGQGTTDFLVENCKLGSATVFGTILTRGVSLRMVNCATGATNYKYYRSEYSGTEEDETTVVRTGGASDGTTPMARKISTTANAKWWWPFESQPIPVWNETTGSITLTVYGIWTPSAGSALPNNDEVWMEVRHMDSSGSPISSIATTGKADILATGTPNTADSSTWGGGTTDFKMAVTITPEMKGLIEVVVKVAAANAIVWIDPLIEIT